MSKYEEWGGEISFFFIQDLLYANPLYRAPDEKYIQL
jgi:hypothetical protein